MTDLTRTENPFGAWAFGDQPFGPRPSDQPGLGAALILLHARHDEIIELAAKHGETIKLHGRHDETINFGLEV